MDICWDIEWNASHLHRRVGSDPANPWPVNTIARRLLGDDCIQPARPGACPSFAVEGGKPTIRVPRCASVERLNFLVAHEVSEWFLEDAHLEWTELVADRLAAAILMPRPAFLAVYREAGLDLREIAQTFGVTETCAALRFGEVTMTPVAMLSPDMLRFRGLEWGWPGERALRGMLRDQLAIPEVQRVEVRDERRRTLLVAA